MGMLVWLLRLLFKLSAHRHSRRYILHFVAHVAENGLENNALNFGRYEIFELFLEVCKRAESGHVSLLSPKIVPRKLWHREDACAP